MNKSEVEKLFAVQDLDFRLQAIKRRLAGFDESSGAKAIADELRSLKLALKELNANLDGLVKRRDELEERSRSLMAKVKNIKAKEMSGAISHRDLATTEGEISNLELQRSDLEDQEMEVLTEIEELESPVLEVKARIAEREGELSRLRKENSEITEDLGIQIAELDTLRSELCKSIDPALLKMYTDVYARVGSVALAKVENGSCQGCRLRLSALEIENVKRLLSGEFSRPPTCEQCGRILYM